MSKNTEMIADFIKLNSQKSEEFPKVYHSQNSAHVYLQGYSLYWHGGEWVVIEQYKADELGVDTSWCIWHGESLEDAIKNLADPWLSRPTGE